MQKTNLRPIRPVLIIFLMLNTFFLLGREWLQNKGFNTDVLVIANIFLVLLAIVSFLMTRRSLDAKNPNVFVRAIYGSFLMKFFAIAILAFVYIVVISKKEVNKPALYASLGLYVLYTVLEVRSLLQLLKKPKNDQA
ncbi:MAG: hypothetical protein NVV59_05915 [Chitinophagaceae bacterium]|nr:hypothetical protein [Chitinophagaceae bacterium]